MKTLLPWDEAEEVAFECEPGTLTDQKLRAIRDIGVTRLSLGVEHFDDHILETNGRAHRSKEIEKAYRCAQDLGFPQINIDLIAGMLEETEEKWQMAIEKNPFAGSGQCDDLPNGGSVQHDDLPSNEGTGSTKRTCGRLGNQTKMGSRGL